MREVGVVFWREFKSYFLSPIAYVIGILFLVGGGFWFFRGLFLEGTLVAASMNSFFLLLPSAFLIIAPALTMRLWSEERKLGTMELLLTFPFKISHLIMGKFLAALAFLGVLLVLTLPYPITLMAYSDMDLGPVVGGYLGAFFMAAAYLSVGLFFSSITRDQIIALILSVLALLVFWVMGQEALLVFLPDWLSRVLTNLSLSHAFTSIARGVLDSRDILYYLGFTAVFLYLNSVVLQAKRWQG